MSATSDIDLLFDEVQATPGSALVETFMSSDESQGPALKPLFLAAGFKLRKAKPHPAGPSTPAGTYNTYTAGPEAARKLPQLTQLAMRNKRELILISYANPELAAAISTEISKGEHILQAGSTNTPTSDPRGSSTPAGSPSASAGSSQRPAQPAAGTDTATNTSSNRCGSSSANAPSSSSSCSRGGGGGAGIAAGFLNRSGSRTAAVRDQITNHTAQEAPRHTSNSSSKSSSSSVCDTGPVVVSDVGGRGRDQDRPQAAGTAKAPATDKTPSSGTQYRVRGPYALHQVAPAPPTLSAPAAAGEAAALLTQLAAMKVTAPPTGNTSSSTVLPAAGSSIPPPAGAAGVPPTDSTFAGCGAAQRPPLRRTREHMNMDMNSTAAALPVDAPFREGFTAAGRGSGGSSSSSFSPPWGESGSGFTVGISGGRGDVGRGSSSRRRRVKAVRSRSGS